MDCRDCKNFKWRFTQFDRDPYCKVFGLSVWCDDVAKCKDFQEKQPNQR